jgi:hypothetical protein
MDTPKGTQEMAQTGPLLRFNRHWTDEGVN